MKSFVLGLLVLGSLVSLGCNSEYRDMFESRQYDNEGNFKGHVETRAVRERIVREPVQHERVTRERDQ